MSQNQDNKRNSLKNNEENTEDSQNDKKLPNTNNDLEKEEINVNESKTDDNTQDMAIANNNDNSNEMIGRTSIKSISVPKRLSRVSKKYENENLLAEFARNSQTGAALLGGESKYEFPAESQSKGRLSLDRNIHTNRDATHLWSSLVNKIIRQNRSRRNNIIQNNTRRKSSGNLRSLHANFIKQQPPKQGDVDILPFSRSTSRPILRTNSNEEIRFSTHGEIMPKRMAITHQTTDTNIRISDLLSPSYTALEEAKKKQRSVSTTRIFNKKPSKRNSTESSKDKGEIKNKEDATGSHTTLNTLASESPSSAPKENKNRNEQEEVSATITNRSGSSEKALLKNQEKTEKMETLKPNPKPITASTLTLESESDLDSYIQVEAAQSNESKIKQPHEFKQLPPPKSVPEINKNHNSPFESPKLAKSESATTVGSMYISQPSNLKFQETGKLDDSPAMSDYDPSAIFDYDSDSKSNLSLYHETLIQDVQKKSLSRLSAPFEKGMPIAIYRKKTSRDRNQFAGTVTYTAARQLVSYVPAPRFKFDSEYRNLKQSLDRISRLPRSHDSTDMILDQTNDAEAALVRLEEKQLHHFRFECLEVHNKFRDLHSVQALLLEYDMCDHAQQWAEHLAKSNALKNKKDIHGQNLFLGIGSFFNAYTIVKTWYDQIQYYQFDNPYFTYETGHFTQLVWKTTKWLGVGIVKRGQRVWVVCNYSPPGNMLGTFRENVRPPKLILKSTDIKKQQEDFIQSCVQMHNELRQRHKVPPLILSPSITSHAMEWAQELAAIGNVRYRPGNRYGENLFVASNFEPTAEEVVKDWYSEIFAYNFKQPGFSLNTGNFTQLVWKRTMEIGVGISKKGLSTIVVCNYNPPGNYTGGFIENVLEVRERNERHRVFYHSRALTSHALEYEINLPIEDQIFLCHNRYRSYHGCPPLVISEELCTLASEWAQILMEKNVFKNRPNNKYGENLFYSSGLNITGDTCVKAWYIEIRKYNFNKPVYKQSTKNFTQLIWKDTKELGIGIVFRDRYTYIVCNYNPCGNITDQFIENVPKLTSVIDAPYLSIDQQGQKVRGLNQDGTRYRIEPTGKTFEEQCLNAHNRYRALHNCPPLILNHDLSSLAADWAKNVAEINSMTHRPDNIYGENLYFAIGFKVTGEDPVAAWYNEVEEYDFGKPGFHTRTGHFTQVIWRETEQLGVGVLVDHSKTFVVCNYYPHGNVIYTFKENVPPPITLKSISTTFIGYENTIKEDNTTKKETTENTYYPIDYYFEFHLTCVRAHNKYRSLHGCPSLRLSKVLCQHAQEWAKHLSKSHQLYHKPNSSYGENVYMAQGFNITGRDPVKTWYDEIYLYDFKKAKFLRETANFTQMIWRSSELLGVGIEIIDDKSYVVCFYEPYGNINEKFKTNVPRPLEMPENAAMLPENLQVLNGPITDELKTRIANRFLKLHNAYRLRHKCPPLELSEKLCEFAQEWADHLAANNILEHRPLNKNGASIFKSTGWNITPDEVMNIWYNEIKNFDFEYPDINVNTSHFTQIVWCNIEFLGVGVAKNNKKSVWFVCNYDPPGNHTEDVKYNVPPPA